MILGSARGFGTPRSYYGVGVRPHSRRARWQLGRVAMALRMQRGARNAQSSGGVEMPDMNTLQDLFADELRDVYDAEKQIVKALPKLIKSVSDPSLKEALSSHLEETRGHVERLEQVFESLELKPRGKHCAGIAGILEEGSDLIGQDGNDAVLDAGIIAGCQRVEHYEITAYGSLMAWAKLLGNREVLSLLKQNEQEEKAADGKLTKIAESTVNQEALAAGEAEDEEEEEPVAVSSGRGRGRAGMR
jgi:ferritin-like metal-binding protein YciE